MECSFARMIPTGWTCGEPNLVILQFTPLVLETRHDCLDTRPINTHNRAQPARGLSRYERHTAEHLTRARFPVEPQWMCSPTILVNAQADAHESK